MPRQVLQDAKAKHRQRHSSTPCSALDRVSCVSIQPCVILLLNPPFSKNDHTHTRGISLSNRACHACLLDVRYNGAMPVMSTPRSCKDLIVANTEGFNRKDFSDLLASGLGMAVSESECLLAG